MKTPLRAEWNENNDQTDKSNYPCRSILERTATTFHFLDKDFEGNNMM